MTIEDKLKEIEKLCKAATEGPWSAREVEGLIPSIRNAQQKNIAHISGGDEKHSSNTAQFIAKSRDLVPRLVKALRYTLKNTNPLSYVTEDVEKILNGEGDES